MSKRWRGCLALVASILVVGCGAAAAPDDEVSATIDVSGLDDPAESTSAPTTVADTTVGPAPDGDAVAEACAAGVDVGLIDVAAFLPPEPADPDGAASEAIAAIRSLVAPELQETLDRFVGLMALLEADPDHDDEAAVALVEETFAGVGRWAEGACDDIGPLWSCTVRHSFEPVGERIDASGPSSPIPEADDAEDLLAGIDEEGALELLDEEGDRRLYGWVVDGRVVRTEEVVEVDGRWGSGASTSCRDGASADDDGFETIGGPVGD